MQGVDKNHSYILGLIELLYADYGLVLGCEAEVTVSTSAYGIPGLSRKGETVVLGTESLPDDVNLNSLGSPLTSGFDIRAHAGVYVRCYSPEHNDVWWYPAAGLVATGNVSIGPTIDTIIPLGSEEEGTDG